MKAFAKNGAKNDESLGGGFGLLNGGAPRALAPLWIFYPLVFISLALPNLIYSGADWFDTLHIMKWAWTMVPVALVSLIAGSMLALFGAERTGFRLDLFGAVWLGLLAFVSLQPFWCDIFAWSTYFKEWFFFASLLAAYIFCYNLFGSQAALRRVLWLANLNAVVNVVFAELLIRDMNDICPLIMNVPGNYIGNTGQQEMFGLWMAMAAMNGIYLHMVYSSPLCGCARRRLPMWTNLFMLAFNSWGLWNSTTRAGMLALFTGTAALALTARSCREDGRALARRIGAAFALVVFMLAVNVCTAYFGWSRAYALINKTSDMLLNTSNIGARREIWITSWNVFKLHPLAGTGLGHYKWHYLEGQREAFKTHPELKWQFTYWAHSEYLQLLAELGIFGAAALFASGAWWLWSFARALTLRRTLSPGAMWGCAMLFLIWFDALFSRPFHRIENAIWMSLAFAWANRELFTSAASWQEIRSDFVYRVFGLFVAVVAAAGLVFFYNGCRADRYLLAAVRTKDAALQASFINRARKSLMERDEAGEQLAYHIIATARATKRPEDLEAGIGALYRSFRTKPQAKQLVELLRYARETNDLALMSELVTYLSPSSYKKVTAGGGASRDEK
ncbi:MAG TPA: O-antigen ligase family protein [Candidatus Caccocola faecigallinarum]|nr:O-antigen ligase family protein [Candidatus Caccocola faecigallinarum]